MSLDKSRHMTHARDICLSIINNGGRNSEQILMKLDNLVQDPKRENEFVVGQDRTTRTDLQIWQQKNSHSFNTDRKIPHKVNFYETYMHHWMTSQF